MSSRFSTLLQREWMQHKRGWLITLLLPPLLFLAILPFGTVEGLPMARQQPMLLALFIVMITSIALFGISYASAMFQLPGLARRDQQDRSIEFWLSLPGGHSESIGATLLAHALLVPISADLIGFLFGGVIASGLFLKQEGMAGWMSVPWLNVYAMAVPLVLRGLLGTLLMTLWLAPLALIVMTASAWLKRWGVPAVALAVGVGGLVLDKIYGNPVVWDLLQAQLKGSNQSFLADPDLLKRFGEQLVHDPDTSPSAVAWSWAGQDALAALQNLASPHLIGGLVVAGACFALMVLRRSRTA
jgi:ABC-2 type transport system permease protein